MNADVEDLVMAAEISRIRILHRTCQSQDEASLIQLLEQGGFDINAIGDSGATALHVALYAKSLGVAEVLITEGANPNITDDSGTTPLQIALDNGFGTVACLLLQNGAETDHLRLDTISLDLLDHSRMESKAVVLCLSRKFKDLDLDTAWDTDTDTDNYIFSTRRNKIRPDGTKIRSTKRPTLLSLKNSITGAGLEDLTMQDIFLPL